MDGLSSAAGVISVASLAIQLGGGLKKLCDFWGAMEDAPEDLQFMVADMRLFSKVLADIALESQHLEFDDTVAAVLTTCTTKVEHLLATLDKIEPGSHSKSSRIRVWTAFKATLKAEKIEKFQETLESIQKTLLLALQNQHR